MAIRHVVWMKFKPSLTPEQVEAHVLACRALMGQIPGLEALECGENFTDRAGGFTHGIIASLPDRDALPGYLQHPAHRVVGQGLMEDTDELLVMDIEI